MPDVTCSVNECDHPVSARGWCSYHYKRWWAYGDPVKPKRPEVCTVNGCDRPTMARDMCKPHYRRWKKTGDVRADIPIVQQVRHAPGALCAVDGCEKKRNQKEWCLMHYKRWRQHGDPLVVAWIRGDSRARLESNIDRSGGPDACHPWAAGQSVDGYGWVRIGRTGKGAHLALWELENGPRAPGVELDHECHNRAMRDGLCHPGKCPHRLCCNLNHLVPRTRDEHAAATVRLSSSWQGDGKGYRKLTEAQVLEMMPLLRDADAARIGEIALRFGISRTHVYRIQHGEAWGWLTGAA